MEQMRTNMDGTEAVGQCKDETPTTSMESSSSRVFTDNFKTILSSVLKTDLGQVLKSRASVTEVEDTEGFRRSHIKEKESDNNKSRKSNTARKTFPKPSTDSVNISSSIEGASKSSKKRIRRFKGGTYPLSIRPKRYRKKKSFDKSDKTSHDGEADESVYDGQSEDESEISMSTNQSNIGDDDDEQTNTVLKTSNRNESSLSNSWTKIELPLRDIITPLWLKPSSSTGDELAKSTWFDKENSMHFSTDDATNGDAVTNSSNEMILCTCQENLDLPVETTVQKETYCQAVDCIDERLVGCCNVVTKSTLKRPARKIPFVPMCSVHTKRLYAHHCCPGCGLFCTQGMFMHCQLGLDNTMHLFHERCCIVSDGIALCPHCGSSSDWIHVRTRINSAQPLTFFLKQQQLHKQPSARMSINRANDQPVTHTDECERVPAACYKIAETGKEISSDGLPMGPDRVQLETMLVNLSLERPMNLRYTIKSFYNAAKSGDVEKILHMLAMSYNPNHKFEEHDNESALHAASSTGQLITVHVLQQAGADLDCVDNKLRTPLMVAVESKQLSVVQYLIRAGVRLEDRGEDGMTSLHIAAKSGNLEACRLILETGKTNINIQDDGGWTPLVWAAEHRHKDVVRYLIEAGSDANIRDNEQNVALHWASFSGNLEICEQFLNRGCDLGSVNEHGDTPLHIAARQDNYDCIILFLTRNADINARNNEDETPIMCCPDENSQSWMALSMSRQLKHFARSCMGRSELVLHRDVSCGKEMHPIQCVNGVDDEPFPTDYLYIIENCETTPINIDRCITSLQSCSCEDDCSSNNCMCSSLSLKCWYMKEGGLVPDFNLLDPPMIFECNRACRCWNNCNNRVVQHGITNRLQLFRTKGKGWGVRTLRDIPQGTFICEYIGEIISDSEADQREDDSYLFDLDNRDGETYCIDARHYGNISRFINHLCEPNLVPVKVFVDHQDLRFPRIAFFSSRDIKVYEELGFDYGEKFWIIKYKTFTCMCHAERCKYSSSKIQEMLENYTRRQCEDVDLDHRQLNKN